MIINKDMNVDGIPLFLPFCLFESFNISIWTLTNIARLFHCTSCYEIAQPWISYNYLWFSLQFFQWLKVILGSLAFLSFVLAGIPLRHQLGTKFCSSLKTFVVVKIYLSYRWFDRVLLGFVLQKFDMHFIVI